MKFHAQACFAAHLAGCALAFSAYADDGVTQAQWSVAGQNLQNTRNQSA